MEPGDQFDTTATAARNTDLELRGPGGLGFKFRGSNTLLLVTVLFLVITGTILFFMQQHEVSAATRETAQMARDNQTQQLLKSVIEISTKQHEEMQNTTFVLTLNDKERKALNLMKPDSLRRMQR